MKIPGCGRYSMNRRNMFKHTKLVYKGDVVAAVVAKEIQDLLTTTFKASNMKVVELAAQMQRSPGYVSDYLNRKKKVLSIPVLAELFYHLGFKLEISLIPWYQYENQKINIK